MKSKVIPTHEFKAEAKLPKFEYLAWRKNVSKYDVSLPHRHNYYEVLVFTKGGGKHEIDFETHKIKSNSIHFVAANQVHVVKRLPGSSGYSFLFAAEFTDSNFNLSELAFYKPENTRILNLTKHDFEEVVNLLAEVQNNFMADNKARREEIKYLFQAVLLKLQRLYLLQGNAKQILPIKNKQALQLQALIEENYKKHWRASDYAAAIRTTSIQLNTVSKQYFGKSTEAVIQERLLLEIKRALVYGTKSIKEICFDLNFEDPTYFIRFFKKHTGTTPLEYRKSVHE